MKKGYFFVIDATLAIAILITGYFLISSGASDPQQDYPMNIVADNTLDLFSAVRIQDLCDGCDCTIFKLKSLCPADIYGEHSMSLLDYFGELYATGRTGATTSELFFNLTNDENSLRRDLYNVHFVIDGDTIYESADIISRENSNDLISSKRIITGFFEDKNLGTVTFWGPFLVELEVWPK